MEQLLSGLLKSILFTLCLFDWLRFDLNLWHITIIHVDISRLSPLGLTLSNFGFLVEGHFLCQGGELVHCLLCRDSGFNSYDLLGFVLHRCGTCLLSGDILSCTDDSCVF